MRDYVFVCSSFFHFCCCCCCLACKWSREICEEANNKNSIEVQLINWFFSTLEWMCVCVCIWNHWDCKWWCSIDRYIKKKKEEILANNKKSKWFWSRIVAVAFHVMLNFKSFAFEIDVIEFITLVFYFWMLFVTELIRIFYSSIFFVFVSLFLLYRLIRMRICVSLFFSCQNVLHLLIHSFLFFFFACGNRLWYNDDDDNDDDYDYYDNIEN